MSQGIRPVPFLCLTPENAIIWKYERLSRRFYLTSLTIIEDINGDSAIVKFGLR